MLAVYTHSGNHPGNHKIQDFLHRVGLEDRDAPDASLNEIFSRKTDYASVNDTVELLRTRSKDFLMEAMGLQLVPEQLRKKQRKSDAGVLLPPGRDAGCAQTGEVRKECHQNRSATGETAIIAGTHGTEGYNTYCHKRLSI